MALKIDDQFSSWSECEKQHFAYCEENYYPIFSRARRELIGSYNKSHGTNLKDELVYQSITITCVHFS